MGTGMGLGTTETGGFVDIEISEQFMVARWPKN